MPALSGNYQTEGNRWLFPYDCDELFLTLLKVAGQGNGGYVKGIGGGETLQLVNPLEISYGMMLKGTLKTKPSQGIMLMTCCISLQHAQ